MHAMRGCKTVKLPPQHFLANLLFIYIQVSSLTQIKYACFKQTSRIFKHVFHRFSAYLTFSRVIRALGKHL